MKRVIYRIHYGFEFIYKSINSIYDWADEIIVVVSREPWYKGKTIKYLGQNTEVKHPENIDYHINNLSYIPKVKVCTEEFETPNKQWGTLINKYSSEYILTMEPDMVFKNTKVLNSFNDFSQIIFINQLEFWRNEFWRIPQRKRPGPVLYKDPKNVRTRFTNVCLNTPHILSSDVTLNYGFCFSPELMLYKHLLALGFSKQIGDSLPDEFWYRDKWLNWKPETINLEISKTAAHTVPRAILI